MQAEQVAAEFYEQAAKRTSNPKGRDMFMQLASFEQAHYRILKKYLESLGVGKFEGYEGTSFSEIPPQVQQSSPTGDSLQTDLDALTLAIEAEKKARAAYIDLAKNSTDDSVSSFFLKLASEENLHRKVLEDQFYTLSNKGLWTWGE